MLEFDFAVSVATLPTILLHDLNFNCGTIVGLTLPQYFLPFVKGEVDGEVWTE